MKPINFEENIVWYTIIGTYIIYLAGAQPILVPILAWILLIYTCNKLWNQATKSHIYRIHISFSAWLWLLGMLVILLTIFVSHHNFSLDNGRLIKSVLKWSREYALWGIFPIIGCLNIRPKLVYRASSILCIQSLILIPICYLAFLVKLPSGPLYVSLLHKIGGNSPDLYSAVLYFFDNEANVPRITLFAPWPPNLALIALIYFFLTSQDHNKKLRLLGMIGAAAMVVTTVSRLAIISFPAILLVTWILINFQQPIIYFIASISSFLLSIFATQFSNFLDTFIQKFHGARASSSEVRANLVYLSLDRWWNEAPIWGHGFTEAIGPAIVYFLPVGTSGCGTWVNLLYTKGIVGFLACAVPLTWSFIELLYKSQESKTAQVALSIILVFFLFSFIEELDLLAYIYWPGLLMLGIALKDEQQSLKHLSLVTK